MKAIPKFLSSVIIMMIAVLVCISIIFAGLTVSSAKTHHNNVISKIEDSNFDSGVINDCVEFAETKGYALLITKETNISAVEHYKVELYYNLKLPLFGKVHTGKLVGYAYPGAAFFETVGEADHYFEINEDGVLGIRDAYRWATGNDTYASNNGKTEPGTKNALLPAEIVIPTYFNGEKVTALRDDMFAGNTALTKISFEEGVEIVGKNAFKDCVNLTGDVVAANSITQIGEHAFENCEKLTSFTFNDESVLTNVGDYAFQNCAAFTSVALPDTLETNGFGAFKGCDNLISLKAPFVGASPTASKNDGGYIGHIFGADDHKEHNTIVPAGLASVSITKYVTYYACYDMDQLTNLVIGEDVATFAAYPFAHCDGLTEVTIPKGVVEADPGAFYKCLNITKAVFQEGSKMTFLGDSFFAYCSNLSAVELPNTIKKIGAYSFEECDSLTFQDYTTGKLKEGVQTIGNGAFSYCDATGFTAFYVPKSVTSIDHSLLTKSKYVTKVEVASENAAYIAGEAGELLTIDKTKIVQYPYAGPTSYTVPKSVVTIGHNSFRYSEKLSTLNFESGSALKTIETGGFSRCPNVSNSVSLPSGVTVIGDEAFYHSGKWAEFWIGPNVSTIGKHAFYDTGAIGCKTYLLMTNAPTLGDGAFAANTGGSTYYVYVKNGIVQNAFSPGNHINTNEGQLIVKDDIDYPAS